MDYVEYIAENLDRNIEYSDYIAENLDQTIAYSEYLAENLSDINNIDRLEKERIIKNREDIIDGLLDEKTPMIVHEGFRPIHLNEFLKFIKSLKVFKF